MWETAPPWVGLCHSRGRTITIGGTAWWQSWGWASYESLTPSPACAPLPQAQPAAATTTSLRVAHATLPGEGPSVPLPIIFTAPTPCHPFLVSIASSDDLFCFCLSVCTWETLSEHRACNYPAHTAPSGPSAVPVHSGHVPEQHRPQSQGDRGIQEAAQILPLGGARPKNLGKSRYYLGVLWVFSPKMPTAAAQGQCGSTAGPMEMCEL